jgi:hypothetical protein
VLVRAERLLVTPTVSEAKKQERCQADGNSRERYEWA